MTSVTRPLDGPIATTGLFGDQRDGYVHRGVDFISAAGPSDRLPIYASKPMHVIGHWRGQDPAWYVGNAIALRDDQGVVWRFWHLAEPPAVPVGARVQPGDVVGLLGSTGNSSGPHIHLETTPGGQFNPDRFNIGEPRTNPLWLYADLYAQAQGLATEVFRRQINMESGWNPRAESSYGAVGLCQIVPRWHPEMPRDKCLDPFESLEYAAQLMRDHLDASGGDWREALANYNVGAFATGDARLEGYQYADRILRGLSAGQQALG